MRLSKQSMLWVGFLAVFIPLAVLLALQYTWLTSLQKTSAIAEKAWLNNYVEAVDYQVEIFYRKQAEHALSIPANLFASSKTEKIAHYFKKRKIKGAKSLFVAKFPDGQWKGLSALNMASGRIGEPDDAATLRAITVALSSWKTLAHKGGKVQSETLIVQEQDEENRMILRPIIDDKSKVLGIAGMVVDAGYFRDEVLPAAIKKLYSKFFSKRSKDNLIIEVRDGEGRLVQGSEIRVKESKQVAHRMSFIFSDWKIALGSRYTTPEEWAKSNFLLNMTLSGVLAVVLLGGVVLALRTASREMRLSAMKSDFVSNVSHELRTPLASIRVFGEFLRLGRVRREQKVREYGEYIETESRRLTQLINNILDFSKIESGAKTYDFGPADIHDVIADTLRTVDLSLKHKGFALTFSTPPEPIPPMKLDPDAMAQAVANLLDNAVKYSDGAKEIAVTLTHASDEVIIAVQDHGIGISLDEQEKIFERFHRVSTGLVHDVKGSGLGLSIVSHIVDAHGGTITVDSEPGRGSTFSIHLPLLSRVDRGAPDRRRALDDSLEQTGSS